MTESFARIALEADQILAEYSVLTAKLDFSKPGDAWIARNAALFSDQLRRLSNTARKTDLLATFERTASPHPYGSIRILEATGWNDSAAPILIRKWRRNLEGHPYASIPADSRKEIFDYYFRHDVHGELDDPSTTRLSRGINDPEYFRPPTIVNVALDVASKNNWFGYSDSLGHAETREAIAALERVRRGQKNITMYNTAVVQGGTAGLHAVLSMLCRMGEKTGCILAAPTYAPILDDVSHHFEPHILELSADYEVDYQELERVIQSGNISAVLISMPHNPYGFRDFDDHLDKLHEVCFKNGVFLICDEIIFDEKISKTLNPIDYPNLVVISSYSKTYSIAGLKLGHILARQDFLDHFYRHASTTYGSAPSFLYLTATCVSSMERHTRDGTDPALPDVVVSQFSNSSLISKDFLLWKRLGKAHYDFQNLISQTCAEKLGHIGIEKTIGLDDPSYNIVLRMKGSGSAYKASMDLIASRNISVMPIECFSPVRNWPRDLRVTIAVEPEKLVFGYPQLIAGIDEIVAHETTREWLNQEDALWINNLGLEGKVKGASPWGLAKRIQERLLEVFRLAGKEAPEHLKRAATLVSLKRMWSLVSPSSRGDLVKEITGQNDAGDNQKIVDVLGYILDRPGDLSHLPELPKNIKSVLIKNSLSDKDPEARVLSAAELFQGISLSQGNFSQLKDTLHIFGRDADYPTLIEAIEQARTLG